jgi:hypothetical protein
MQSGGNKDVVRKLMEELSARPEEAPAVIDEFWDPDGDYYPVRKFPEARLCHGREAIAGFLVEYLAAWSPYRYTINDLTAIGDDRVLVSATLHATGRESEMTLEGEIYHSFWLRHGRVLRQEDHLTLRGARHALGLDAD